MLTRTCSDGIVEVLLNWIVKAQCLSQFLHELQRYDASRTTSVNREEPYPTCRRQAPCLEAYLGQTLGAGVDVVIVLPALRRSTEDLDADAGIAYAMAAVHFMFRLSLQAYEAIDIGSKQPPVLAVLF
jgi:hypothetical protein